MSTFAHDVPMLTVTDLAKRFDVTVPAVSNWLRRYGPESPAPLPVPDKPAPNPTWRAERWPEFELWNEQRTQIKRGPKRKKISRRSIAGNLMAMDDVLVSIGEVVAYAWDCEQLDIDDQDDDGKAGHIVNHLTVLKDFLTTIGANAAVVDASSSIRERDETGESDMLTVTQLAAELGVTKASVHGWYVSTTLPVRFPRPVVDPLKVEGQRREKRLWSSTQLPEARAWLLWYRQYKLRNLTSRYGSQGAPASSSQPATESTPPPVSEFLKDAKRGTRSGVRRGRIARNSVRKLHG